MIRLSVLLLVLGLLATSCSTPRFSSETRFYEQDQASLIVRYYTDDTSYVLKPQARDGQFLTVLNKEAIVELARQQTQRDLAVIVLIHYGSETQADSVKRKWRESLATAGYQRVVFLRGRNGMSVNGLPIVASLNTPPLTCIR
jgi:hypothetical protein